MKKKQDKKGQQSKKGKSRKPSSINKKFRRIIGGGEEDNNIESNADISSTNIKKDELYKTKESFLKIMKNTKLNKKINLGTIETNNLYILYDYYYKRYLNNYFEDNYLKIIADESKVYLENESKREKK